MKFIFGKQDMPTLERQVHQNAPAAVRTVREQLESLEAMLRVFETLEPLERGGTST